MKNKYRIDNGTVFMECVFEGSTIDVILDIETLELLKNYPGKWHGTRSSENTVYVRSNLDSSGQRKRVYLHRFITNCPKGLVVDHINHNTLDNRIENLRVVPQRINMLNPRKQTGVRFYKARNNWCAKITIKRKEIFLGYFNSYEDALEARKRAEIFHKEEWLNE